jgi:DnaK suppressor protein
MAMTTNELTRFQAGLTARVAELERLVGQRDGIAIERSADQMDEFRRASERALAVSNLDRESRQLKDALAALRRIQEGSFGTCLECEQDIPPKRLAAVPWTPFCIQCQESVDRNPEEVEAPARRLLANAA